MAKPDMSKNNSEPPHTVSLIDGVGADKHGEDFAVIEGTLGPKVIDVGKLYAKTGYFTYDPGYMATASCQSKITFVDGEKGILLYRGWPIENLYAIAAIVGILAISRNEEIMRLWGSLMSRASW